MRCAIFDIEIAYTLQGWAGYDNERCQVPESPRFSKNHHDTTTVHADVSMVLLRIMKMRHVLINRGEP